MRNVHDVLRLVLNNCPLDITQKYMYTVACQFEKVDHKYLLVEKISNK